ncbi:hypothetical protein L226DRAFT_609156 [Lentinus tigrinus ALCF2SS1-7]|uniref:DUF6533 domain-containing protein n=1 Tax=Lentinus tigrinus ALCF2SS1-6 TaxID=1328759 RepID=A0A5C2ST28_9APHY|nr:hypothetical protein L227DRAFT_570177 [Lentinus tigrinus ALCF2SS1-6]RPD80220.1 hypothetical protein L226DRAFT_609156 [Lentinus tigrinus ALCF2SS1-7]
MDSLQHSAEYYASSVRVDTALTLAAFTVLYFDYSLTVTSEINWYWSPPSLSLSSFLFALSRYFGLLGPIPVFFEYVMTDFSEHRCRQFQLYHQVYAIMSQGIVAILLILRTYALYNCSKRMLIVLIGMHIGGGIQCLTAVLTGKSVLTNDTALGFKIPGCNLALTNDQGLHLALAWSAMLWFDSCIFALTFWKAIQVRREVAGGLLVTIFRDGTVYYAILVAVNVVNILTFLVTPSNSPLKGSATTLTNVLSVTLTSRLMLNLRDPSIQSRRRINGTSRHEAWTTGQFSSRMMSFRAPTVAIDTFEMSDTTGTDSSV